MDTMSQGELGSNDRFFGKREGIKLHRKLDGLGKLRAPQKSLAHEVTANTQAINATAAPNGPATTTLTNALNANTQAIIAAMTPADAAARMCLRDVVTKALAEPGTLIFSIEDCLRVMSQFICNPSMVGYFIERAVLQTISSSGIACVDVTRAKLELSSTGGRKVAVAHLRHVIVTDEFIPFDQPIDIVMIFDSCYGFLPTSWVRLSARCQIEIFVFAQ
ncbi:hypothetical protein FQN54_008736 [Arachnomyces sp. PD_36]|nr:hypothetical protein FQN54_008736 [Arachnomyces sp. PD_36]